MKYYIINIIIFIIVFTILFFLFGLIISIILTFLFIVFFILFMTYHASTGLIKSCLKFYYNMRLSGKNHEDTINYLIKARMEKQYEIQRVIDLYNNMYGSTSNDIESNLCDLFYSITIVDAGVSPMDGKFHRSFIDKFYKVYEKKSKKFERFLT